jgi:hypothetical protein
MEVLKYAARFMQYCRENAKYLERTYGFIERVGIEKIRSVVVDDSEGIAARLDAAIDASIAAYKDPWQETYTAARPTEFASVSGFEVAMCDVKIISPESALPNEPKYLLCRTGRAPSRTSFRLRRIAATTVERSSIIHRRTDKSTEHL